MYSIRYQTLLIVLLFISFCLPYQILVAQNTGDKFLAFKVIKYFDDATEKSKDGEYSEAISDYDIVLSLNPDHPDVHEARANTYFQMGEYEKARKDYTEAITQHPQKALLYNNRGLTFEKLGFTRYAIWDYERALRIRKDYKQAKENLERLEEEMRLAEIRDDRKDPVKINSWEEGKTRDEWEKEWKDTKWEDVDTPSEDKWSWNNWTLFNRSKVFETPPTTSNPNNYVTIEKIRITPNSTDIIFRIKSPPGKMVSFKLHRPGTKGAFYITDRTFRKRYRLVGQKGLAGWDREVTVYSGKEKSFMLSFDKIPNKSKYIHLLEGEQKNDEAWNFYDIELKN